MFFNVNTVLVLLSVSSLVRSHGAITGVTGNNNVKAAAFGIIATTPRTGSTPKPFEQDTSIIRDREINSGKTGACGRTPAGGNNDVASQLAAASQAGLPTTAADGSLSMTLHQVNQDGAGPYKCEVSGDGGNTFSAATVTQQVPGVLGLSLKKATDFSLVATMPAGMACTAGPNGDACIMRCRNQALAGPFGGCVAFASGNSAAAGAAGNETVAASAAPTSGTAASTAAGSSDASAAPAQQGGLLGGLISGLKNKLGRAENGPSKRYINSRVAGARSGYWI
ncbi:hypothetical protein MIND_00468000 [Mycena indigotica]|uniref:GEgh 16 protein n=1 Tax=Mycena indigotica TaxID=2126181 RepID=A0A8H6SVN8_9AGAR|nr:uncharacterized protein MIND_00468000 [Mycena indigotica]KAF7306763.1 hypothetical protein MIND_00468000 [Mycena indigotica]